MSAGAFLVTRGVGRGAFCSVARVGWASNVAQKFRRVGLGGVGPPLLFSEFLEIEKLFLVFLMSG